MTTFTESDNHAAQMLGLALLRVKEQTTETLNGIQIVAMTNPLNN